MPPYTQIMINKFLRNYELSVQGNDGSIHTFNYPLTLEFSIKRNILASANTASFRILNLSQNTRNVIFKDQFDLSSSFRSLVLRAGYQNDLATIFTGNVKMAQSYRLERSTNFVTEIEGYDYGWVMVNAQSSFTLQPGVDAPQLTRSLIVNRLVDDLIKATPADAKLGVGVISPSFNDVYSTRAFTVGAANTWNTIQQVTQNNAYIDQGKVYALFENEAFDGSLATLNSETGLLGTPKKADRMIICEMLFEPRLQIGQQINLESRSLSQFNGSYKVYGLEHRGIISGAVGGDLKTIVTLLLPFNQIQLIPGIIA